MVLWDLKKKKHVKQQHESVHVLLTCCIEPQHSKLLACGGLEPRIFIYSINKDDFYKITRIRELLGHIGSITSCAFLDDHYFISGNFYQFYLNHLFPASNDSSILLWDLESSKIVTKYKDHENEVLCMDICNMVFEI